MALYTLKAYSFTTVERKKYKKRVTKISSNQVVYTINTFNVKNEKAFYLPNS